MTDALTLTNIQNQLKAFRDERDWAQFHTPKNLAMALMVEAAELCEHFQWQTPAESQSLDEASTQAVAHEMADVLNYLLLLADQLNIDLLQAADRKIALNKAKYPADQCQGSAAKYTAYSAPKD